MLINSPNLANLFTGFETSFNKGFEGAESHFREVSMIVPSITRETTYGWLGQFPKFREWLGDRVLNNLKAHSYTIENKDYENTLAIPGNDIADDQYGIFGPMFEETGRLSKQHPDELIFKLLKSGFSELCYDGQYFFDSDHPVKNDSGAIISASNYQSGASTPWYMLDCSRAVKPLIFQERQPYKFTALDKDNDENVFMRKEYIYGVTARVNAGFSLWQLAYGSKALLNYDNFTSVRAGMRNLRGDEGRPLGIRPTHLVVPPSLEEKALTILETDTRVYENEDGITNVSNPWKGTMKLVVSEWLE